MPTPLLDSKYAELDWDELDAQLDLVCAEADQLLKRLSEVDLSLPSNSSIPAVTHESG